MVGLPEFSRFSVHLLNSTSHAVTSQTQSIALACPTLNEIKNDLDVNLSTGSSITSRADDAPRWSLYGAPRPVLFVKVASERDVAKTVRYCNKMNITFLAQSQGNGWADTFHLGKCGLLINMAGLNKIQFK
ncbi:MAG: hypothetical protein L6R40_003703 [Gallowayella cf. fulva]|nr:MAG: hypothetical protein L6R40_003703 [Xanthomendoza cf. fulva]